MDITPLGILSEPKNSHMSITRNVGIPYRFSGEVDIQSRPTVREAEVPRG